MLLAYYLAIEAREFQSAGIWQEDEVTCETNVPQFYELLWLPPEVSCAELTLHASVPLSSSSIALFSIFRLASVLIVNHVKLLHL